MTLTLKQKIDIFGDPTPYIKADGSISLVWQKKILASFELPAPLPLAWLPSVKVTKISCHWKILPWLQLAFMKVYEIPDAWKDLDDYGGCYNWRLQRKANVLSSHAFGISVDIDVKDNPQGHPPHMHSETVRVFNECGFEWGGIWKASRVDGMHMEFIDIARL